MTRALLLGLALLPSVEAHRPQTAGGRVVVDDPTISWVYAGEFHDGDEVFVFELTYETPFAMPIELMVPVRKKWADHRPAYAVIGPGLPQPSDDERAWLPIEVEEGDGVFIDRNDAGEREVYFEQVMRRTLYTTGSFAIHLPQASTYEIVVWVPQGTTGDFQLGFGVEEDFSDGAWGPIFSDWGAFAW
jgi:hypothetical protein